MNLQELAREVDEAAVNATPIPQLSLKHQFSEQDAYEIQKRSISLRYQRGEKPLGIKLGFTSKAKMEQMGVHDLIWGRLTDAMLIKNGGDLKLEKFIHPRAEPEICFLVGKTIDRPLGMQEAKEHIIGVCAAMEIIDSRYEQFKFSLEDVIADNCSSAGFVLGPWHPRSVNLSDLAIELKVDNKVVHKGGSKAILGDPWESVVAAARLSHQYGETIPKGSYILAGAATPAIYVEKGQVVSANVALLGEIKVTVD